MISGFEDNARFEFWGPKKPRQHSLCPHCGKQGNKVDETEITFGNHRVDDTGYVCATCNGEWTIRRYHERPFEKYPQAPYACIYVPVVDASAPRGDEPLDPDIAF